MSWGEGPGLEREKERERRRERERRSGDVAMQRNGVDFVNALFGRRGRACHSDLLLVFELFFDDAEGVGSRELAALTAAVGRQGPHPTKQDFAVLEASEA